METPDAENLLLVLHQQQSRYALSAEYVEEILRIPSITALPLQPEYLRGIFHYKGHAIPVFSLQALCGGGLGEQEGVCVVLRMDDTLLALTADSAESLIADSGQRMKYDETLLDGRLIKLACVLPGDPAVLVLDINKMYHTIESDLNREY